MTGEVWSFLEVEKGHLADTAFKAAAEASRTARTFGLDPCGILFGIDDPENVESLHMSGLKRLYLFKAKEALTAEIIAHSIARYADAKHPEFLLFAHTPLGAEIGARVAVSLHRGLITNCTDLEIEADGPVARKPICGGKADVIMAWDTPPPRLATINLSALEDVRTKQAVKPEIITEHVNMTVPRLEFIREWEVDPAELDLAEARIVIGVGKGVKPDYMDTVHKLARLLKAVVGGTRIAVFAGMIPPQRLIGTTGKWLSSDLYIAIGISGAPQHVMGIKGAKRIIAVDISKDASIFQHVKLGILADLYEVIPQLIDLIEKEKDKA
ncbi:MAG: electron transfer flavoprotein subunit alpha/FixB family protein [Syntrophorhabdaceae bacterium]|nr:electron transfer flavoprotein subunit alpha/FixB family protein [Syntrophorhabdaceae bacterium]MDD5242489.1 electron transfer flavoprotein subunit alpha/FixB family protein [Syntrophorhabdaceae bacterium]